MEFNNGSEWGTDEEEDVSLSLDNISNTFEGEYFEGNYDDSIKAAKGDDPIDTGSDAAAAGQADAPPAGADVQVEEFKIPESTDDWKAKAETELKEYLDYYKESAETVKTEDDYLSLSTRLKYYDWAASRDNDLAVSSSRLTLSDEEILAAYVEDKTLANEFATKKDVDAIIEKYFSDDEKPILNADGIEVVKKAREFYKNVATKRHEILTKEATEWAQNEVKFRRDTVDHVKGLKMPEQKIKAGDLELSIPEIEIPNGLKYKIIDFLNTNKYSQAVLSEAVTKGEGYKAKTENALWVNEETRNFLLAEYGKAVYKQAQSDYIKNLKN